MSRFLTDHEYYFDQFILNIIRSPAKRIAAARHARVILDRCGVNTRRALLELMGEPLRHRPSIEVIARSRRASLNVLLAFEALIDPFQSKRPEVRAAYALGKLIHERYESDDHD